MATWLRSALTVLAAVAALAAPSAAVGAAPAELRLIGNFSSPIHVAAPMHEDHLLFVVERGGRVRVVRDGVVRPQPFLDITALVNPGGEGGLLSIAFPPRYGQSGRFFVYYTDQAGSIRVVEYRRSESNPELADPLWARPVLTIPHPTFSNHYGGSMEFGPDGLLYIGTGDGGGGGDPFGSGQNLGSLLGKLLRIDPLAGEPYAIPPGNPFVGVAGARPEIFAYGLRNPWRFSFDRSTGDLVIADVGQGLREEVDFVRAPVAGGLNFGWNAYEGSLAFSGGAAPGAVFPVLEYAHSSTACSITGGVVVRDAALTTLAGRYVYGDWCGTEIRAATLVLPSATGDAGTGLSIPQLVSFGEDAGACVYAVSLAGAVYRLADRDAVTPIPCADVPPETTVTSVPAASTATAASIEFLSSEAGSSFECRLDVGAWSPCSSPTALTLTAGTHVFDVRAADPGGTFDPTPATASLTVFGTGSGRGETSAGVAAPPPPPPPPLPPPVPLPVATPSPVPAMTSTRTVGVTRSGTAKADTLTGTARNDTLRGRGGNDVLKGLGGNDLLVGGVGRDNLFGGGADDTLKGRDGWRDLVDCGSGRDTATVDRHDVVRGCEKVVRSK